MLCKFLSVPACHVVVFSFPVYVCVFLCMCICVCVYVCLCMYIFVKRLELILD